MSKLHELLAVEATVAQAADKLIAETNEKFNKSTEFFTGYVRQLKRLNESLEDKAIERSQYKVKELPTNIPNTISYILPYVQKSLNTRLSKHKTNAVAKADIMLRGSTLIKDAPVDFLLDLERFLPKWRNVFATMPTLDPSREWVKERDGVWKGKLADETTQTEKVQYPVVLAPATDKHAAQVKEASKDVVVGTFQQTHTSGAATTQQKADALALCDELIIAVKEARMRANSAEVIQPGVDATNLLKLFEKLFE